MFIMRNYIIRNVNERIIQVRSTESHRTGTSMETPGGVIHSCEYKPFDLTLRERRPVGSIPESGSI